MRGFKLEEIEEIDETQLDDIVDGLDESKNTRRIGLTLGILAITGVVATPIVALLSHNIGASIAAFGTTTSILVGILY